MENSNELAGILDMEFSSYLKIARELLKNLVLAEDRRVADKHIRNCLMIGNGDHVQKKVHRNRFFRYLLKTMRRTIKNQALNQHNYYLEGESILEGNEGDEVDASGTGKKIYDMNNNQETKQWSRDRKSYICAKIIPGFGTLIYMACTQTPENGWQENGFASFYNLTSPEEMVQPVQEVIDNSNPDVIVDQAPHNLVIL